MRPRGAVSVTIQTTYYRPVLGRPSFRSALHITGHKSIPIILSPIHPCSTNSQHFVLPSRDALRTASAVETESTRRNDCCVVSKEGLDGGSLETFAGRSIVAIIVPCTPRMRSSRQRSTLFCEQGSTRSQHASPKKITYACPSLESSLFVRPFVVGRYQRKQ